MAKVRTFKSLSDEEQTMVRVVMESGRVSSDAVAKTFKLSKGSLTALKANLTRRS